MWTYLKRDAEGEWLPGEKEKLPPPRTAYLAFDSLRWKVVIAYTEPPDYQSILTPNVCDDCNIIAFAPLDEQTEPDITKILTSCPWTGPAYPNNDEIILMRGRDA